MTNALKSLPTHLSTKQLDDLIGQFPKNAVIEREPELVKVSAPNNGPTVLRGVMMIPGVWHVMALEDLVHIKKG